MANLKSMNSVPEKVEFEQLEAKILSVVSKEELKRYLWLRENLAQIILREAGRIAEERMNKAFPRSAQR